MKPESKALNSASEVSSRNRARTHEAAGRRRKGPLSIEKQQVVVTREMENQFLNQCKNCLLKVQQVPYLNSRLPLQKCLILCILAFFKEL